MMCGTCHDPLTMQELLIITTGGTIDKIYFDDKSDFQVGEPQIGRMLDWTGSAWPSASRSSRSCARTRCI